MKKLINILNNNAEKIVFFLFCVLTIIVSCFHEPWFDELQAWAISKDTLYNVLFVIPHYEGHPPLWHLILKCFSYFNVPVEYGLKIPNLLFMFGAVWLLIFKSPFPKPVKLLLPFTYFIFYQFAIISRPYSIFCFALFLAAFLYKERNEHPYRFMSSLALLCLSCFYGILIAGGITISWLIENLKTISIKEFLKSKICYSMSFLLLLAVIFYFVIKPNQDVAYNSLVQTLSITHRFLYAFLVAPLDALFTDVLNYHPNHIVGLPFLIFCFLGILVNIPFLYFIKAHKKMCLFIFPFLLFALFITFVYVYCHHIGLLTIFYIFIIWCVYAERETIIKNNYSKFVNCILIIALFTQLCWSYTSILNEIKLPYCFSKDISIFIKNNDLDKYKISAAWYEKEYYIEKSTKQKVIVTSEINETQKKFLDENFDKITDIDFNVQDIPVTINAYFDNNIFYTYNLLHPEKKYRIRQKMSKKEVEAIKDIIKEQGLPDVVTKNVKLSSIFSEEEISSADYVPLKQFYSYRVWKNHFTTFMVAFYIRKALNEELKLNNLN